MEKSCEFCGKIFRYYKSETSRKYCSRECKNSALSKIRKVRIKVSCSNCGKEKEITPSKKNKHNFCNRKCMGEFYSKKGTLNLICKNCGKNFTREKHRINSEITFCSNKCACIYTGEKRRKIIKIVCDYCNKEITRRPCEVNRKDRQFNFCNKECKINYMSKFMSGENNPNWKGGHDEYRGPNWIRQRRSARERDNKACVECGNTGKNIDLVIHHIVPFRFFNGDYRTANKIRNLKTLCRSCHAKQESHLWNEVPEQYKYLLKPDGRR